MPATLVQTQHQQQHKRTAMACSRPRHVGLPRSLEDLHASLLRVGARRAGISSLSAPSKNGNGSGDVHRSDPTPPLSSSSTTTTTTIAITPREASSRPSSDFHQQPPPIPQRPPRLLQRPPAKHPKTPPNCSTRLPAGGGGSTTTILPSSKRCPSTTSCPTNGVVKWVWGEDAAAAAAAAAATAATAAAAAKRMPKEVRIHVRGGGGAGGRLLTLDGGAASSVGSSRSGSGGGSSPCEKLLFAKQQASSSLFDSECSTEAPTERTLSIAGSQSSARVRITAHHHHHILGRGKKSASGPLRRQQSTQSAKSTQSTKSTQSARFAKDVDDPFIHRLSDMSLRFPEPPTRPPPAPATSASRAVTISGWGRNIASSLPSVQVFLPGRWRKNVHARKRCRKSTSLWVARSKATTSMTEASSFQQNRNARYNSKTSASNFNSRSGDTPTNGNTLPNGVTPLNPPPLLKRGSPPKGEAPLPLNGNTLPNGNTPPKGENPLPPNGDITPNEENPHANGAEEEEPCHDNDDNLLPLSIGNALPPPPPPPDMVAPAPPRTPALKTLVTSSFTARRGVAATAGAAGAAAASGSTPKEEASVGARVAAAAPPAASRVWEWGDDPVNPYRINAGRPKRATPPAVPRVVLVGAERRQGSSRGDLWGRVRRGEARGWPSVRLPGSASKKKGGEEAFWRSDREAA